jgi:cytochrome c biogenesis protein CcmG/thiol:disulfide interchange protein DsbE
MKHLLTALIIALYSFTALAQSVPEVKVKNMDGVTVSTSTILNEGKPMIISFWATWCKPCIKELETIHEVYADWVAQTGVKLVIVSIDDARTTSSVAPFLNAKGWEYESYLDVNSDFRRAMNVNMVPHTFLLNGNREVIDQHTSFALGDEEKLFEKVKAVVSK